MPLATLYVGKIRPMIDQGIEFALDQIEYELREELKQSADDNVYSYIASDRAMKTRRGTIASDENIEVTRGRTRLTVRSTAELQHDTDGDVSESDVVQQGLSSYRQPYKRPFISPAVKEMRDSGRMEKIIEDAIRYATET